MPLLLGLALPLSYSHLLFNPTLAPFPRDGLGVLGAPSTLESLPPKTRPNGDGVPKLFRFATSRELPTAFCHIGLAEGEYGEPLPCLPNGLSFRDRGEFELLLSEPVRGVGDRGYLGGVMYWVVGVDEGVTFGSRPSKARWVGVRGMSVRSSFGFTRGRKAVPMLKSKMRFIRRKSGCVYA